MYNPTKNPEDRKIFNKALAVISKYFAGGAGPMAPVVTGHARLAVTPPGSQQSHDSHGKEQHHGQ